MSIVFARRCNQLNATKRLSPSEPITALTGREDPDVLRRLHGAQVPCVIAHLEIQPHADELHSARAVAAQTSEEIAGRLGRLVLQLVVPFFVLPRADRITPHLILVADSKAKAREAPLKKSTNKNCPS